MRTLIENTFALSTKLIKKSLKKAREKEPVEGEYLNYRDNGRPSALDYSIEYSFDGNTYLVISVAAEPQKILLSYEELTYGTRTYLTCGCGQRSNALYLKLGYFACRRCQNLGYRSTTINTTSDHGMFVHLQTQRLKLMDMREGIDRIFYKSTYTKRFRNWLKLCGRAGLLDEITSAIKLSEAINKRKTTQ
jgi:hypothetical protein